MVYRQEFKKGDGTMRNRKFLALLFILIPVFSYVLHGWIFYIVFGFYLISGYFIDRRSSRVFKRKMFWFFVLFIVVSYPLIMPGKDIEIFGLAIFSKKYLIEGINIGIIGATMFVWLFILTRSISPQDVASFFKKLGMKDIGIVVSIAMNLLPFMVESIETSYMAMRLKGGFRWSPKRVYLFVLTVFRNTALLAENLTIALALEGIEE